MGRLLPNPHLLISPYLRREAVLSSRIEGVEVSGRKWGKVFLAAELLNALRGHDHI